eukprot:6209595-Pleurochrysis_carterae.AAC.5
MSPTQLAGGLRPCGEGFLANGTLTDACATPATSPLFSARLNCSRAHRAGSYASSVHLIALASTPPLPGVPHPVKEWAREAVAARLRRGLTAPPPPQHARA